MVTSTSLIAIGTPASGPSFSPAARRRVDVGRRGEGSSRCHVQEGVNVAVDGGDAVEVGLRGLDAR